MTTGITTPKAVVVVDISVNTITGQLVPTQRHHASLRAVARAVANVEASGDELLYLISQTATKPLWLSSRTKVRGCSHSS